MPRPTITAPFDGKFILPRSFAESALAEQRYQQ